MKVVKNICYGGFGLTVEALIRIAELKGKKDIRVFADYDGARDITDRPEEWDVDIDYIIADGEEFEVDQFEDEGRADPELVQAVEELGEKAWGPCAELEVVEVPDDVKWEIEEYDGIETIAEIHRTW